MGRLMSETNLTLYRWGSIEVKTKFCIPTQT